MKLNELQPNQTARIDQVGGEGALRQHFLDMGVIPGAEITMIKFAPLGDPMELRIHGYELTLRLADAEQIEIEPVKEKAGRETALSDRTAGWNSALNSVCGSLHSASVSHSTLALPDRSLTVWRTAESRKR